VGAAALVGTLALAGCGSGGVMHNGRTALTYDGHKVTNSQLQTAAAQISKAVGATVDPSVVAGRLAIGPEMEKYAASKGQPPITDSQIRAQLPKATLSPTTLEALRTDALISTLANDAKLDDASLKALSKKADVTVNPRYGTWSKGTGIVTASTPWIKKTATPTAAASGNGHPAG
jgi:hypothetical protein